MDTSDLRDMRGDVRLIASIMNDEYFSLRSIAPFFIVTALSLAVINLAFIGMKYGADYSGAEATARQYVRLFGLLLLAAAYFAAVIRLKKGGERSNMLLKMWGVFIFIYIIGSVSAAVIIPALNNAPGFGAIDTNAAFYKASALAVCMSTLFPAVPLMITGIFSRRSYITAAAAVLLVISFAPLFVPSLEYGSAGQELASVFRLVRSLAPTAALALFRALLKFAGKRS